MESQQGAKIPAHVGEGGGRCPSIRKGLRHPGIRSTTYVRRQIGTEDGCVLHDVSGTGAQATRPPTRGSASPETEVRTADLKPGVGPGSIGFDSDVRFVMVIYDPPYSGIHSVHTHTHREGGAQSLPRRRCLPGQSTSGCTTRMCRVSASLRLKVFSSVHRWQRTFCLRALWIVSSWRVKS